MRNSCPVDEAIEYIKQLRYIGNNINQIAYVAQKTGNIDTPMLKDLYRQQFEIIAATKRSLSTLVTFDIIYLNVNHLFYLQEIITEWE